MEQVYIKGYRGNLWSRSPDRLPAAEAILDFFLEDILEPWPHPQDWTKDPDFNLMQ